MVGVSGIVAKSLGIGVKIYKDIFIIYGGVVLKDMVGHSQKANDVYSNVDSHMLNQKKSEETEHMFDCQVEIKKGKTYLVHIEFSSKESSVGEEVRELLKNKVLAGEFESLKRESKALQSHEIKIGGKNL